jgi:hypothetical protein
MQASDNLSTNTESVIPVNRASLLTTINESRTVNEQEIDAITRFQTSTSPHAKPWDPNVVPLMYPQLLPYGCGGPGPKFRTVAISPENWYRNSLKLTLGQFARHPEYLMERADTFNKSEGIRSTCMSMQYSNDDEAILQITPEQVSKVHKSCGEPLFTLTFVLCYENLLLCYIPYLTYLHLTSTVIYLTLLLRSCIAN